MAVIGCNYDTSYRNIYHVRYDLTETTHWPSDPALNPLRGSNSMADATHDVADGMRRHAAAETDDDNYTPTHLLN